MPPTALRQPTIPPSAWQSLPQKMRMLYITTFHRTGGWLAEAFAADSAAEVHLEEAIGTTAGLAKLRDEAFEAVLVSHEPGHLDALELIEGYRAGGAEGPVIVLGTQSEQEMSALCYEVGADAYVCVNTTTTRHLIWVVARAIQRHQLIRENRRLFQNDQRRLQREHEEAERLLRQQRTLISDLESLRRSLGGWADPTPGFGDPLEGKNPLPAETLDGSDAPENRPPSLPPELISHYRELLRTYVIMGSGNLSCEMARLGELLVTAGVTARQTMHLHLHVLEELIRGLGARSTRHVMTRADLLVLEIMMHLAEGYRQRYQQRVRPLVQRKLPGFEAPCPPVFR